MIGQIAHQGTEFERRVVFRFPKCRYSVRPRRPGQDGIAVYADHQFGVTRMPLACSGNTALEQEPVCLTVQEAPVVTSVGDQKYRLVGIPCLDARIPMYAMLRPASNL